MTGEQESEGKALLKAIAAKDESAIAAFYRLYESTVYRFSLSRLNDPIAAADILNEVMMEVWKSAAKFEGRSKVSTWLLGITHFKIIDQFRAKKRHEHEEMDDDIADESPAVQQDALLEATQDAQLLKHALSKLSPEHRQVLHLAFFEDMNYREIGQVMGVSEGTIKSRIYHAKKLAKTQLQRLMVAP
ncbi:sigma-70 family RNA polymerase sigma factor [Gilvimarinus agarilyticus]|uniref:RNA polymerase sigma factor n=1 Tax=unclassified Gilvimarinus TaxID=2642066 RepID=UPI001C0A0AF9|nr:MULTISPECIES: sigma-70 family RNA polymerase sigma factor [unclassified Gilvimarinus]MBU2886672.1 sigma-70 family RNA polymerase sigma factor [Gilvimarinus agarilyticus]MDO6571340.1 sigma-70 family RNA polymerase sigma factor [Gilvimarinus sp. 2_MG-2023]MDO6746243.1 sigma-70 family RNA polymerase sigma factor [Gilvimarinus sp. 1_MG-2023]